MKKTLLIAAAMLSFGYANAQMKLGNNPTTTNTNAVLEMEATNKGLLLPRVALTSTTDFAPLSAHVAGMAIYNTATAGDVTPGYYFDNGTAWVRIADANAVPTNLYTADGTLAGARTVTMGANNLSFMGTGNVGIGTTSPGWNLDVVGTVDGNVASRIYNKSTGTNASSTLVFGNDASPNGALIYKTGSANSGSSGMNNFVFSNNGAPGDMLFIQAGGSEKMRLTHAGNVGIGTTTPVASLQVVGGNGGATSGITLGNTSTDNTNKTGNLKVQAYINANPPMQMIQGFSYATGNTLNIGGANSGSMSNPSNIFFRIDGDTDVSNSAGASNIVPMAIVPGGAVGIGTTNPLHKLHVVGSIRSADSVFVDDAVGIGTTTPKTKFHVAGTTSGLNAAFGDAGLTLTGTSAPRIYWENTSLTSGSKVISASLGGDGVRFDAMSDDAGTMNQNIMTLAPTGKVGIGGALTPAATLDVNGNARILTMTAMSDAASIVSAEADGVITKIAAEDFINRYHLGQAKRVTSTTTTTNIPMSSAASNSTVEFTIISNRNGAGDCAYFKGFATTGLGARINIVENQNICDGTPATYTITNNLTTSVNVSSVGLTLSINTTTTPHSLDVISTGMNFIIEHRILR